MPNSVKILKVKDNDSYTVVNVINGKASGNPYEIRLAPKEIGAKIDGFEYNQPKYKLDDYVKSLENKIVEINPVGTDGYKRTLATVKSDKGDLADYLFSQNKIWKSSSGKGMDYKLLKENPQDSLIVPNQFKAYQRLKDVESGKPYKGLSIEADNYLKQQIFKKYPNLAKEGEMERFLVRQSNKNQTKMSVPKAKPIINSYKDPNKTVSTVSVDQAVNLIKIGAVNGTDISKLSEDLSKINPKEVSGFEVHTVKNGEKETKYLFPLLKGQSAKNFGNQLKSNQGDTLSAFGNEYATSKVAKQTWLDQFKVEYNKPINTKPIAFNQTFKVDNSKELKNKMTEVKSEARLDQINDLAKNAKDNKNKITGWDVTKAMGAGIYNYVIGDVLGGWMPFLPQLKKGGVLKLQKGGGFSGLSKTGGENAKMGNIGNVISMFGSSGEGTSEAPMTTSAEGGQKKGFNVGAKEINLALSILPSLIKKNVTQNKLTYRPLNLAIRPITGDPLLNQRLTAVAQNHFAQSKAISSDPSLELVKRLVTNRQADIGRQEAFNIDSQARMVDTQRFFDEQNRQEEYNNANINQINNQNTIAENNARTQNALNQQQAVSQAVQNGMAYVADKEKDRTLLSQMYLRDKAIERQQEMENLINRQSSELDKFQRGTLDFENMVKKHNLELQEYKKVNGVDDFYTKYRNGVNFKRKGVSLRAEGGVLSFKKGGSVMNMENERAKISFKYDKLFFETANKYSNLITKVSSDALDRGTRQVMAAYKSLPKTKTVSFNFKKLA